MTIYATCLENGTAFDDIEKMDIVRYIYMAGARMYYKSADDVQKTVYKYIDEW